MVDISVISMMMLIIVIVTLSVIIIVIVIIVIVIIIIVIVVPEGNGLPPATRVVPIPLQQLIDSAEHRGVPASEELH